MFIYVNFFFSIANVPIKLDQLGNSVSSELDGNPPIWVTKKSPEEIYVNQARIVNHLANYEHVNTNGKLQVRSYEKRLYLIHLRKICINFVD